MGSRLPHQRDVAFVQVAHGRHQRHAFRHRHRGAQAGDGFVICIIV
jgi:hypothetical protein